MSITPRCDSATLPETRGLYILIIFFHDKVLLGDVCLQQVVNISFLIYLSLLLNVQLILTTTKGNILGSVCIVFQIISSLNDESVYILSIVQHSIA